MHVEFWSCETQIEIYTQTEPLADIAISLKKEEKLSLKFIKRTIIDDSI